MIYCSINLLYRCVLQGHPATWPWATTTSFHVTTRRCKKNAYFYRIVVQLNNGNVSNGTATASPARRPKKDTELCHRSFFTKRKCFRCASTTFICTRTRKKKFLLKAPEESLMIAAVKEMASPPPKHYTTILMS